MGCEYTENCGMFRSIRWFIDGLSEWYKSQRCYGSETHECSHYQVLKKIERLEQQLQEIGQVEV